jgi:hypothetical protein
VTLSIDTSDVRRLAGAITGAGVRSVAPLAGVVRATAAGIQAQLRSEARGHQHFPSFPASITTDVRGLTAEIGPDKNRRQGALGNLLYFGTARTGAVLPHPERALEQAEPGLIAAVEDVVARVAAGETIPTVQAPPAGPRPRDGRGRFL